MENDYTDITKEELDNLSLEELADLKIELDDLTLKLKDMLIMCDDIINN